jgi:hypothetical protein
VTDDTRFPQEQEEPRLLRRLGIIALALGIFIAAGTFAWRAFLSGSAELGPTVPAGYPSPPASGYWVLFPDAPELVPARSDGTVDVIALTNLPEGTIYATSTSESGSCCPAVSDGHIALEESNGSCYGWVGSIGDSPGLSITITTSADLGQNMVLSGPVKPGGGEGSEPPHQPDSVLEILGDHFENLTGDQVVMKDGEKQLVATASYPWPEPQCGPDPLPLFGGPTCEPSDYDNQLQGDSLEEAMGEVMGALSQARMCEFWSTELPPEIEALHPWPEFAAQWRAWYLNPPKDFSDAQSNSGWTQEPFTWRLIDRQGDRYFVDVTDHGEVIASLEIDALPDFCPGCDPNVVPFWGVVDWTLH